MFLKIGFLFLRGPVWVAGRDDAANAAKLVVPQAADKRCA